MKVVKHAHHGTIFRLPNEDAHLLVSSGRYVYSSKFEARTAAQRPRRQWPRIATLVAAGLAVAGLLMLATSAKAADLKVPYKVCLTQAQAQQVFKGRTLKPYLSGNETCWTRK